MKEELQMSKYPFEIASNLQINQDNHRSPIQNGLYYASEISSTGSDGENLLTAICW